MKPDYQRGGIELYCGDCMEILPQLKGRSVDAVITDPPYGIDYQSSRRIDKSKRKPKILNDKLPFIWFLHHVYHCTTEDGFILVFCRWDVQDSFKLAMEWSGYKIKSQIIWDRVAHGMGDLFGSPAPQHDVIWFGVKGEYKFPGIRPKSVIDCMRVDAESLNHPNEKPVNLMSEIAREYTKENETILDPFMGSGTTGVACIRLGRKFIGIEKEPKYFEIAVRRIEKAFDDCALLELAEA
jgi:DNA modification methylase